MEDKKKYLKMSFSDCFPYVHSFKKIDLKFGQYAEPDKMCVTNVKRMA